MVPEELTPLVRSRAGQDLPKLRQGTADLCAHNAGIELTEPDLRGELEERLSGFPSC